MNDHPSLESTRDLFCIQEGESLDIRQSKFVHRMKERK